MEAALSVLRGLAVMCQRGVNCVVVRRAMEKTGKNAAQALAHIPVVMLAVSRKWTCSECEEKQ